MKKLYFLMSFLLVALIGSAAEVTDVLTSANFPATNTTYTAFTGVKSTSTAVYAGKTSLNNGISIRSKGTDTGIVTTTSGGKLAKIVINWSKSTTNGRTVQIYGKNAPYTSANDLFNSGNQGNLIKEVVINKSNLSETIIVNDSFEFVGLKSKDGALYLESVEITWSDGAAATKVSAPVFTPAAGTYEGPQNISIESATKDATITYTINGGQEQTYTAPIALTQVGKYTIKAKATDPTGKLSPSSEVVAEYVINLPVCEAPTFDIKEGTYYEAQNVVITSLTEGASITYSVTKNDVEFVASTTATSPVTVALPMETEAANYVITAKATKEGMTESAQVTAKYTLNPNKPVERPFYRITKAEDLVKGDRVIFVAENANVAYALAGINTNHKGEAVEVKTFDTGNYKTVKVMEGSTISVYEVALEGANYTFCNIANSEYLTGTSKTDLKSEPSATNNAQWKLDSSLKVVNVQTASRGILYQESSGVFGHYATSNANQAGYAIAHIFKYVADLSGVESNVAEEAAVINTVAGGVVVAVSEPATAAVYTVSGQLVANQVVDATATINLASGFYIVKVGNTVKKVIVR